MRINKSVKNAIFLSITNYGALVFTTVSSFIIRSFISPLVFGGIAYVSGILNIINQVVGIITNASIKEVAVLNSKEKEAKRKDFISTSLTLLISLLLLQTLIFFIISLYTASEYLKWAFIILGLSNLFAQISNYKKWVLTASSVFKEVAIAKTISGLFIAILTIMCAYYLNDTGYYLALILASIINFILISFVFYKKHSISFQLNSQILKSILTIGSPIAIYGVIIQATRFLDRFYIEQYLGIEMLGLFSISYPIISMIQMFVESITNSYSPKIFENSLNITPEFIDKLKKIQRINLILSLGIISVLIVLIHPLLDFFLPQYASVAIIIKIQLLGIVFINASLLQYNILYGKNKITEVLKYFLALFFLSNLLFFIGVKYGIIGISISIVAVNLIGFVIIVLKSTEKIQDYKYLIYVFISLFSIFLISEINVLASIGVEFIVLIFCFWNLISKQKILS